MKFAILEDHREFFGENGYISFEKLVDPEGMSLERLTKRRQLAQVMAELADVSVVLPVESEVVRQPKELVGCVGALYLSLEDGSGIYVGNGSVPVDLFEGGRYLFIAYKALVAI